MELPLDYYDYKSDGHVGRCVWHPASLLLPHAAVTALGNIAAHRGPAQPSTAERRLVDLATRLLNAVELGVGCPDETGGRP